MQSRSRIMRSVRQKDTGPELIVRKTLHSLGLRFRLHRKGLPGTPDIVLPKYSTAIFVHGCFWHRHPDCKLASTPKTRQNYWIPKFEANIKRDARKLSELQAAGWKVRVIWECETRNSRDLQARLAVHFLGVQSAGHA